ncbi:MAG: hypothetical protein ACR2GH_18150 [Pseudonocardia sp.]
MTDDGPPEGQLSADERAALDELLPAAQRTGVLVDDLTEAARRSMQRRIDNTRHGGAVLAALHRALGSWRQIEARTGIAQATARRWASPPPDA